MYGIIEQCLGILLDRMGQIYVASGVASILNATTPMFTVIVAHF